MNPLNIPTSAQMRDLRERFDSIYDDLPRYEIIEDVDAAYQFAKELGCCTCSRLGHISECVEADEYGN
jgi:hypothetical protein